MQADVYITDDYDRISKTTLKGISNFNITMQCSDILVSPLSSTFLQCKQAVDNNSQYRTDYILM